MSVVKRVLFVLLVVPSVCWSASGTLTADGNTSSVACKTGTGRVAVKDGGGSGFGGGTATLQWLFDNDADWETVSVASSWTADSGAVPFDVGTSASLRINLNGATTPDVDWEINCDPDQ